MTWVSSLDMLIATRSPDGSTRDSAYYLIWGGIWLLSTTIIFPWIPTAKGLAYSSHTCLKGRRCSSRQATWFDGEGSNRGCELKLESRSQTSHELIFTHSSRPNRYV
jgi:hypothetical protein